MTATLAPPPLSPNAPAAPVDEPPTPPADPRWARPALVSLLGLTSVLYLWGLGASGWANSFYSAAVQAGTRSWSAFFFGASDAAGSITVDKPPASLWVMEISARVFGLNSWSILVPEALMGVGAVYLLYLTVRRWAGAEAGLLAGLTLAVTPVATLMFKFNNPDAMLVLLMVAAVYASVRAVDAAARRAGTRWLMLAGALVGLAFLTKSLQALLVVPGLGLLYLIVAPTSLRRRLSQLLVAGAAMLVSGLWWVVAVTLTPASSRPYIGGSQHNSVWELIWGYNGLGRLTGNETGSVGGGGGGTGTGMWGSTGLTRLFDGDIGGQIAWLLPAALMLLAAGLWFTRRAPRTDRSRGLLIVWGGWLVVTGLTFSEMKGIFHQYYTVALAPAIAAVVGVGAASLWRGRRHLSAALIMAATVARQRSGPSSCSTAAATGTRGCATPSCSAAWSPPSGSPASGCSPAGWPQWWRRSRSRPAWRGPRRTRSRRRRSGTAARSSPRARRCRARPAGRAAGCAQGCRAEPAAPPRRALAPARPAARRPAGWRAVGWAACSTAAPPAPR